MKKRILIIAPHTDDGEFGCGGSIVKFIEQGDDVYYAAFSTAEQSVPAGMPRNILETEVKEATGRLGILPGNLIIYKHEVRKLNYVRQDILEELVKIKKEIDPHLVLTPVTTDIHQDHSTVAIESIRAFKQTSIWGYELPWNNISFRTQAFIRLDNAHIEKKISAIRAYKSQAGKNYTCRGFIRGLAKLRGVQIGSDYAEAFEVTRWVM